MSVPTAIDAARRISDNLGQGFRQVRDENAIDTILAQAMKTNDQRVIQNSIGQILSQVSPQNQGKAVEYLQNRYKSLKDQEALGKQHQAAKAQGIDPHLPPGLQKVQFENKLLADRANNIVGNKSTLPPIEASAPQGTSALPQKAEASSNSPQLPSDQNKSGYSSLTDDQLVQLSGVKGYSEPAKQELKRRQEERKLSNKMGAEVFKKELNRSSKFIEKTDEIATSLPQKESALQLMEDAVLSKDLSFWSGDNLAELTGIEGFRSKEGSVFKTAGKEFFLGSISRAGARPNQWVEQQIADMMLKVGRSTGANLSVARAFKNELDLDKERVRLTNEIADKLKSEGDLSQGKLGSLVNKALAKYAEKKQVELFNDLRAIKAIDEKQAQKYRKVESGTQISKVVAQALLRQFNNDPKKAEEEAKKLGYSF